MIGGVSLDRLADIGPWALAVLVVLLMFTGTLVPSRYYKEARKALEQAKETNSSLTRAVGIFADALPDLIEVGKTTDKVMTDLRDKSEAAEDQERVT